MKTLFPLLLSLSIFAPALSAQGSLAEQLPSGTQLYFEIPDLAAFRTGFESSTSARIWNDPEIQGFLEGVMPMIEMGIAELRSEFESEGVPSELLEYESFQSLSLGLALGDPMAFMENQPQMVAAARLEFPSADLASQVFALLQEANPNFQNVVVQSFEGGQSLTAPSRSDGSGLELSVRGNTVQVLVTAGDAMEGSLAANSAFQSARSQGQGQVFAYLEAGSFVAMMESFLPMLPMGGELMEHALSGTGLNSLGNLSISGGWNKGDSTSSGVVSFADGGPTGLFSAITNTKGLDLNLISYIPSEATSFSISSSNLEGVWEFVTVTLDELIKFAEASGAEIPTELPVSKWITGDRRDDLGRAMAAMGPRRFSWGVMDATALMGGGSSKGGTFTEVRDVALVREINDAFSADLADTLAMFDAPVSLHSKNLVIREKNAEGKWISREGPKYWTLKFSMTNLPQELAALQMVFAQIQPSWGITDDGWLVEGGSSAPIRKAMRSGVQEAANSIRNNAEVASFLNRIPETAISASWSDSRPLIGGAITMAQGFLPMLTGLAEQNGAALPVDLSKFPSGEAFTRHIRPSESWSLYQNGQVQVESVGSFGVAEAVPVSALLGFGIGFGYTGFQRDSLSPASGATVDFPTVEEPPF